MITLTAEQAQQIEVALDNVINDWVAPDDFPFEDGEMPALDGARNALATIRAARAHDQAEQEPVAWMHKDGCVCSAYDKENMFGHEYFNIPLYAAQQPVQDIMEAVDAAMAEMQNINPPLRRSECERLIRAANYAAPVQQVDLTDYEIVRLYAESPMCDSEMIAFARAVIAADREKNK